MSPRTFGLKKKRPLKFSNESKATLYVFELSTGPIREVKTFGGDEKATSNFRDDQSPPKTSEQIDSFKDYSKITKQASKV